MYRLHQIRLDQHTQIYTGLGHDVQAKLDQTRLNYMHQTKTRPRCTDQIRSDHTKVPRPILD